MEENNFIVPFDSISGQILIKPKALILFALSKYRNDNNVSLDKLATYIENILAYPMLFKTEIVMACDDYDKKGPLQLSYSSLSSRNDLRQEEKNHRNED